MKRYMFLLLFFGLFSPVYFYAQDNSGIMSLDVKGIAAIRQSNVAGAREEAIQNALKAAIIEATARLMSISVEDERFQTVKSIIIDEPGKYIKIYKIITEMKQPNSYEVNVNVVV